MPISIVSSGEFIRLDHHAVPAPGENTPMPRGNKSLPAPAAKKKPATASPSPRKGRKPDAKPAPAAAATPPKLISPSRIARYFFQECPRYLRYSSTPKELWAIEGVPEPPFDHSPVTTAILEGGYTWEEEVVANRLKGRVFIAEAKPDTRLKDRVWGASETRRILDRPEAGRVDLSADLDHAAVLLRAVRDRQRRRRDDRLPPRPDRLRRTRKPARSSGSSTSRPAPG